MDEFIHILTGSCRRCGFSPGSDSVGRRRWTATWVRSGAKVSRPTGEKDYDRSKRISG